MSKKSNLPKSLLFLMFFFMLFPTYAQKRSFSMEEIMSYPFPTQLAVSSNTDRVVWAFNENGHRNLFVTEGPDYQVRQLTFYIADEGQELTNVKISSDGNWVIFIRGGDFGSNWGEEEPVNPQSLPDPPKVQLWGIPFAGGEPILLGEGLTPAISPTSDYVAFSRSGQIWKIKIDGSEKAEKLFTLRGRNGSPVWSPDGKQIAFVSSRGDHSYIGIYPDKASPIIWLDPSYDSDSSPRWSPDGKKIVFIRQNGRGGTARRILGAFHRPWEIRVATVGQADSKRIWKAPETLRGNMPTTQGRANLHWAAAGRIIFLSYQDGWPHLYSISENGGKALLLTPGNFMAEYIQLSPDGKFLVFAGNTGNDPLDIDRRHIVLVSVNKPEAEVMTPGTGLEWTPIVTGKSSDLVFISATPKRPPLPAVMNLKSRTIKLLAKDHIPAEFPLQQLVMPKQVIYESEDGWKIHATLFKPEKLNGKNPAIIYVHGGPPRQMLLGWHYSSYYSNAYAVNQYLVSQGFVVLSVNYRLGIGYGYEFHHPVDGGARGASEYKDVKAGALWLASQEFVDPQRIGIYGGSYGGYLTALALGRNSDLFAAGVDISGVHDRTNRRSRPSESSSQFELPPDLKKASKIAWESSPVSSASTWKSPVLIIHADDDRNVAFEQSTDLVQRLRERGVYIETLAIPDDTHHFLLFKNQLRVNKATVDFFIRFFRSRK
jgi:dipeptidyl aminopeptidase/acylaminoacyl peptidase